MGEISLFSFEYSLFQHPTTKIPAFDYLNGKRGSKGKEIVYKNLSMAEYLLPWNRSLSNEQKLQVFAIRNRMIDLPCNLPINDDEVRCSCGEIETMEHIYNSNSGEILFEKIYNGTITEIEEVLRKFNENIEMRKLTKQQNKSKLPCDPTM